MLPEILIASLAVMAVSLIGAIAVWKHIGDIIERNLSLLVSFSAGIFLVVAFTIAREAIEEASSIQIGLLAIFGGALGAWLLFQFMPQFHHHHDCDAEEHDHSPIDARRILLGDTFHNIGDGILLAAAFSLSTTLGFAALVSVMIHELVQEISEFFVLRHAGYSTKKALITNFAVSSTILIGALGGFLILESAESLEPILLGLSAGVFLLVVFHDLIPHSIRTSHKGKSYTKYLVAFLIGLSVMGFISHETAEFHTHGEEEEHEGEEEDDH